MKEAKDGVMRRKVRIDRGNRGSTDGAEGSRERIPSSVRCDRCGKAISPGSGVDVKYQEEDFLFCGSKCADQFMNRRHLREGRGYWKENARESTGSGRTLAMITVFMVMAIVAAGAMIAVALKPPPRMLYADLLVTPNDVMVRTPAPSGDNLTAIMPVTIEILNQGEGNSSALTVWCGAYNLTQPNVLVDDFSTSELRVVTGGEIVDVVAASGKHGSIVNATGTLDLQPGNYTLRVKIYEDGKRTLVSGQVVVRVDKSSVVVPNGYVPGGGGHGRSYPAEKQGGTMPGFDAVIALPAVAIALVLLERQRRRLK
jgi:ribosomal protein L24E